MDKVEYGYSATTADPCASLRDEKGRGVTFRKISGLDGQSYGAKRNGEICGFTKSKSPCFQGLLPTPNLN
jgi:hypothetical protein